MHDDNRAMAARCTCLSLLLTLGAWGSPALARAQGSVNKSPAASSPVASGPAATSSKPATPAAGAGTPPAATAKGGAAASAKPKRKLPMRACPAKVPEELNPPPDVTLETVLPATGVQSYACAIEKPGEAPDWTPKGPHATLGDVNNPMGIHFGGPSWQAMDGSLVKGTKVAAVGAPDKSAIAWMLLSGSATGEGIFANITHIQRMETVGGRPPQGGCDAAHLDTRVLVPYRTYYYFYREAAPGETVRQCRGEPSKAAKSPAAKSPTAKSPTAKSPAEKPAAEKASKTSSQPGAAAKAAAGQSSQPASEAAK